MLTWMAKSYLQLNSDKTENLVLAQDKFRPTLLHMSSLSHAVRLNLQNSWITFPGLGRLTLNALDSLLHVPVVCMTPALYVYFLWCISSLYVCPCKALWNFPLWKVLCQLSLFTLLSFGPKWRYIRLVWCDEIKLFRANHKIKRFLFLNGHFCIISTLSIKLWDRKCCRPLY